MKKITKVKIRFKNIKTKDGDKVKLEIIEDLSKYRGFYYIFPDGEMTTAGYNSSRLKDVEEKYTRGYSLEASNLVEHLFNKIKNKQELSEYEKKDFYHLVNLSDPVRKYRGIEYDFREILVKVKNVQFWTISKKPNKEEKSIYESGPVYADYILE